MRLLLLLPCVYATFNLGFELCSKENSTRFYGERIAQETDVDYFSLADCQQTGDKKYTVVCNRESHIDLKLNDSFLRVSVKHARLAECSKDIVRTTAEGDVLVESKCKSYHRLSGAHERFYLVCDEKLPSKPLLLIVSGKFKGPSLGHSLNGAFYGWNTGVLLTSVILLILIVVKSWIRRRTKKKAAQPLPIQPKLLPTVSTQQPTTGPTTTVSTLKASPTT